MERWSGNKDQMTEEQVQSVLENIGLEIQSETETNLMVFCPYHSNTHSAALSVSKESGVFYCFGAGCGESGNLVKLIMDTIKCNFFAALRLIEKYKGERITLEQRIEKINKESVLDEFPRKTIYALRQSYIDHPKAQKYMLTRKITPATAEHFHLGYDKYDDKICVPVFGPEGQPVGYVGRCIEEKKFKNSWNLPTSKTLFNYNNARKTSHDEVIIVESSFDAMRVWQATGRPVVATLGGTFSDKHLQQLYRSFNCVTLGVDNDQPGRKFASRIAKKCRDVGLKVKQAEYSESELYPHGAKDFGDCSDNEIKHMINNSKIFIK